MTEDKISKQQRNRSTSKAIKYFRNVWKCRQLMLMLVPTLLYFLIFRYGAIFGIVIGFQNFVAQAGQGFLGSILRSEWVGLKHFIDFFNSMNGTQILKNTILISFYKLIYGFPAPIILALLLNEIRNNKHMKIIQSISYLPNFISWVILAGMLKLVLSPDYGLIVPVFKFLNIEVINFLADPKYFRSMLVVTDIWRSAGWGSILFLAAISGVDNTLYEAAKVDGAGRLKQLIHITIPSISNTIILVFILRVGHILNAGFDQVFNLYNPAVYAVGDILDTYIYRTGLLNMRFSYTTAIGVFQSFIGFTMVMFANILAKRLGQKGIG